MSSNRVRIETGIYRVTDNGKQRYQVKASLRTDGRRRYKEGWAMNLCQARKLKAEFGRTLQELAQKGDSPTFAEFVRDDYFPYLVANRSASTIYRQKSAINAHLIPALGDRRLDEITTREIELLIDKALQGRGSQTKKHLIAYASDIFKRAIRRGLVLANPVAQIERPKIVRKDRSALNEAEAKKLLAHLQQHYPIMFFHVALALHTLCRAGELRALTWADVDFETKQIVISKTCDPKTGLKLLTKNSEIKRIPINLELQEILADLQKETLTAPSDPVLPHWREFAAGEQAKPLKIICRTLGITEICFHDLRATGITLLLLKNVALPKVMHVAGHKRISSTNIYLRLSGREVGDATQCLRFLAEDPVQLNTEETAGSPDEQPEASVEVKR